MKPVCRVARGGCRCRRRPHRSFAQQSPAQTPPAASSPPRSHPTSSRRRPSSPRSRRSTRRRSSSARRGRGEAGQRAGDDDGDRQRARSRTRTSQNFAELLRAVPGVNMTQVSARDINVTSRARHRHARDRAARAARRPQPLPGLLRLRDVGLPAGQPERDQADRSHPRAGVGGLGRQRAQRRRQRDHASRRARCRARARRFGLGGVRRGPTARTPASLWYVSGTHAQAVNDRWAFKLSAGGYSQDPLSRPTGTIPVRSAEVCTGAARTYPRVHEHRHHPAEVRRPRRLRLPGRREACRSPAASPAPTASCTPASARSTSTAASVMGYGKVNFTEQGLRVPASSRNILNGDADNLLARDRSPATPITFDFKTKTYDFEASNVQTVRHTARRQLRRQPALQHVRPRRSRRSPTTAPSSASTRRTRSSSPTFPAGRRRRASIASTTSTDFVFSPRTTFMIKPQREPDVSRCRTTAPTARRR